MEIPPLTPQQMLQALPDGNWGFPGGAPWDGDSELLTHRTGGPRLAPLLAIMARGTHCTQKNEVLRGSSSGSREVEWGFCSKSEPAPP